MIQPAAGGAFELWGFRSTQHNGVNPTVIDGNLVFTIHNRECSRRGYGDGRSENDCTGGNVTSYMIKPRHAKPGDTFDYHLEFNVDPRISYEGYFNDNTGNDGLIGQDSRLRLFAFLRDAPKNHIYEAKLDSKIGVSFMGRVCISPSQFGKWSTIDMRVHWASDETGSIQVKCNGKTIYEENQVITTLSPQCYITNHCESGKQRLRESIHFSFGLRMDGFGSEWKKWGKPSQFTDIQPDGITVAYRSVRVRRVKQ